MAPMVNNVVRDVLMERANVWLMLLLMRSAVWFLLNAPLFSRIRSKITNGRVYGIPQNRQEYRNKSIIYGNTENRIRRQNHQHVMNQRQNGTARLRAHP